MVWLNDGLTTELATIANSLRRSTVRIWSHDNGNGSGVIWSPDGVIVTNAHVVTHQTAIVELWDGRMLEAAVTARNLARDLVALQVAASDLPAAPIADTSALRVGELVLAMGNPLGLTGVLTIGMLHALGCYHNWLQADVTLAPGNSGGPLANAAGHVIGINTMIVEGRGFAVPSHVVQQFLSDRPERPRLGVTLQPVRVPNLALPNGQMPRQERHAHGWLITQIAAGTPADSRLWPGDILLGVRERSFQHPNELLQILERAHIGDGLALWVLRGGQVITVDVVLCRNDLPAQAA